MRCPSRHSAASVLGAPSRDKDDHQMLHLGLDGSTATMLWVAEIVFFFLSVFWRPAAGLYLLIPLLPLQTIRYRLHGYFLGAQFVDVLLLGVILGLRRRGEPLLGK